ncbi:type II secretion system F family protein [Ruminiclostridium cellobioparum]|uniref:Flp pilus assembly protein TadC n=1 Tax=Ruminiclostridium cellobioparum subsp. termitidis CT1112 TaxID=1195236 RepID=S0FXW5_RUMCE|nr:type II secretion system F family protein [Ruminiclostridium cellobioparum]EMS73954.1 Flp pilus assembly protein TadC [Ruminiclostridium cellobioparum subsp. termitidis CT1112]
MLLIKIITLAALMGSISYLLVILAGNYARYLAYIKALDKSKDRFLKRFLPIGLYVLDRYGYSFNSAYDRRILNFICEVYGQEYSFFYIRVMYANKIALFALFVILELITALASGYDLSYMIYIVMLMALIMIVEDTRLKNRVKLRRLEIQLEFPNFINKLTLLLNAGMTMSKAWEKISGDRTGSRSTFYQEVEKTVCDLKAGKNEAEAYSQFAKRVKVPEISRLMSTILQNTKRGGTDLVLSLRLQSNECWEMRKSAVRKLGEEASTKLLFPMMIMFFAILIIVVTPAVLSMQGIASDF